ncbi:MAG: glycine zipper 2TM domain-containing protein [Burkholderiales bacterium]|nr:glycine zipper 2TM domain-containing protein [Burkholderiales bacterium]
MNKRFLLLPMLCVWGFATAQDMGRVISSTPVMQQVGVPRQVCTTEQVEVQPPKSGAGAALGAIAGGALGSAAGHGPGRAAATVIGAIGGAVVGDRIEGTPDTQIQSVQRCGMQTFFENRTVAYNVVYEYAGKQYAVQMPNDPGATIALQVAPVGANAQGTISGPAPLHQSPIYIQPATSVIVTRQFYPYYYPQPLYAPIAIDLGFGYRDIRWGRGHGYHPPPPHWR